MAQLPGRPSRSRKLSFRVGALLVAALLVVLVVGLVALSRAGASARSPEQRRQAASDLLAGIHVKPSVGSLSLAATSAIADFGGKGGVHLVGVRIVDQLHLQLRIETG